MTNTGMFFRMLFSAVFRRRSRAVMAVVASLVGAATLFCLAMICLAVPQQMNEEMRAYGANLIVTPASATNRPMLTARPASTRRWCSTPLKWSRPRVPRNTPPTATRTCASTPRRT